MAQDGLKNIQVNLAKIRQASQSWVTKPPITGEEIKAGLNASRTASAQPRKLPMTPLMRNLLERFGDIEPGGYLLVGAPVTKAEKWLDTVVKALLQQQTTKVYESYDDSLPLRDIRHYYVDCWLNWNPEKLRDVQPGQIEEVNSVIGDYSRATKVAGVDRLLRTDPVFCKAVSLITDSLPRVSATRDIKEVNLPFQTKHTNVGFVPGAPSPRGGKGGFGNDRTVVPGTQETYAQLTMRIAEGLKDSPEKLNRYNITVAYDRLQRGKGRLILAVARIINLVLNQLEHVEIDNYKLRCSYFAGYNDDEYLRRVMEEMLSFCEKNGYVAYNLDYHRYDIHVLRDMIELVGAISMDRCVDKRSADLAMYRAALMTKTWTLAGTLMKVVEMYGRIFSGFIDTNRGGGVNNALVMTYCIMKQDLHYVRDIHSRVRYPMLVMGDDVLAIMKRSVTQKGIAETALKTFGAEIDDPSKNAYGIKFLQWRLFELNGKLVMVYAWTRVLRSLFFKERGKGLGPCGWELAFYQQMAKLIDAPEFLAPVVNIAAVCDEHHLMLDIPVSQIIEGANKEDEEAKKEGKRITSTARALYDGDPSKARQFKDGGGQLDSNYFQTIQDAMRSVYDPKFFENHSLPVPPKR